METKQTNRMVRIKNKQVNEISARVTGTPTNQPGQDLATVSIPAKAVVVATIVVIVCCAI